MHAPAYVDGTPPSEVLCCDSSFALAIGQRLSVRPLERGDEATVQAVFDAMSIESRLLRFHRPVHVLSDAMRQLLADVDGDRHRAAVAWLGDDPVAMVRTAEDPEGARELAVEVVDSHQRRGIGSALVTCAIQAGEEAGTGDLTVLVHAQNRAAISLFRRHGFGFTRYGTTLIGTRSGRRVAA